MGDDDDFFTRLGGRDDTSQNRLRNAPHDNDDVPMAVPPLFEEDEEETPLEQLIRHWMKERHAPDVLPVAEDVLSRLLDHIWIQNITNRSLQLPSLITAMPSSSMHIRAVSQ